MSLAHALRSPVGHVLRAAVLTVAATIRARIHEARATLAVEVYLVISSLLNGVHTVTHPHAYEKGWSLIGLAVSQGAFGVLLVAQGVLRAVAIGSGSLDWRYRAAVAHFLILGTAYFMIRAGNVDSPVLPSLQTAMIGNLWTIGAAEWAKVERKRAASARGA